MFYSRKGTPVNIFSDSKTDFTSAVDELGCVLKEFDIKLIGKFTGQPPATSHLNGTCEHRFALYGRLLEGCSSTNEHLHTTYCILGDRG